MAAFLSFKSFVGFVFNVLALDLSYYVIFVNEVQNDFTQTDLVMQS